MEIGRINGIEVRSIRAPVDKIVEFTSKGNFDLVVVGSKGRSKVERFHLGATSDKISHHSTVPVLSEIAKLSK